MLAFPQPAHTNLKRASESSASTATSPLCCLGPGLQPLKPAFHTGRRVIRSQQVVRQLLPVSACTYRSGSHRMGWFPEGVPSGGGQGQVRMDVTGIPGTQVAHHAYLQV